MKHPALTIPKHLVPIFWTARIILWVSFVAIGVYIFLRIFFPSPTFEYFFSIPHSSRDTIFNPRTDVTESIPHGRTSHDAPLVFNIGTPSDFSTVDVRLTLAKDSSLPKTINLSLRKSIGADYEPTGDPITTFDKPSLFVVDSTYYERRSDILFPFVSEAAYKTNYPAEWAETVDASFIQSHTVSEEWLGWRSGTLVSFDNGIFVVDGNTLRPIGDPSTFLALGYQWDTVLPASEEEIGIYKKSPLLDFGTTYPDGTILHEKETDSYSITKDGQKHPLPKGALRTFLLSIHAPIIDVSRDSLNTHAVCTFAPGILLTARTYTCSVPLDVLSPLQGADYEFTVTPDSAIHIDMASATFRTIVNRKNLSSVINQIRSQFNQN